ncbi:MAG: M48 family metallopeptidase [Bryobacteraceae bacterium]
MKTVSKVAWLVALSLFLAPTTAFSSKDKRKDPSQIGNRDVAKGVNLYSLEKEIELGRQLAQQIEKESRIVDDPVVSEYVNRIAQNIARNSDVKVPVTARVIDDDQVNAFALPGGYLFVNTGLVRRAGSEAELAGVIAHELAHVAARHGTRQASRGQVASWLTLPLIFMGGWAGYGVQQAANLGIPLTFLRFSRDFEREADMLGIQYLYAAGYDPTAYIDFFERIQALEKTQPGALSKIFLSHPPTDERIAEAQATIQAVLAPQPQYVVNTSEFVDVHGRLERLLASRKAQPRDDGRPTLRRGTAPVDARSGDAPDQDGDRPTLKRTG